VLRKIFGANTVARLLLSILFPNIKQLPSVEHISSLWAATFARNTSKTYNVSLCGIGSNLIKCDIASSCRRLFLIPEIIFFNGD